MALFYFYAALQWSTLSDSQWIVVRNWLYGPFLGPAARAGSVGKGTRHQAWPTSQRPKAHTEKGRRDSWKFSPDRHVLMSLCPHQTDSC